MGLGDFIPVIGHAVDAVTSGINSAVNANQARKNRAFQERMYEKQKQDNIDFWKMQQDYNLPSAVLQRMRDAGLNPLMMYEGGAGQLVANQMPQSATAPHGAQAQSNFQTNFGQAIAQSMLLKAQIEDINAHRDLQKAQEGESRSRTRGNEISNYVAEATKDLRVNMEYNRNDLVLANIRSLDNAVFQTSFMNAETAATMAQAREFQIKYFHLDEKTQSEQLRQGLMAIENGKISANAQWKSAGAALMNAISTAKLTDAQIVNLGKVARKYDLENEWLDRTMEDRVASPGLQNRTEVARRDDLGWSVLLKEAGISDTQSKIFQRTIENQKMENDMMWQDINNSFNIGARLLYMAPMYGGK